MERGGQLEKGTSSEWQGCQWGQWEEGVGSWVGGSGRILHAVGGEGTVGGGCKQWGGLASEGVGEWEESGAE